MAATQLIELTPGNDSGVWVQHKNVRLKSDGEYTFAKLRGGTDSFFQFAAGTPVLCAYDFEARVNGAFKKYIVAQLTSGAVVLRNLTDSSTTTIDTGFSTSIRAKFSVIGQFLYVFNYTNASTFKNIVCNLASPASPSVWNGLIAKPIDVAEWITGDIVNPNIWGHEGEDVYVPPFESEKVYRAYVVVDLLEDGSVTLPGRPIVISTPVASIVNGATSRIGVKLTMPAKQTGTFRRVLAASRWSATAEEATNPSTEIHPNSPYFIIGDVAETLESGNVEIEDRTPDSQLLRDLNFDLPMVGGVPVIYGPNQLRPISATAFKGSLFIEGFDIQRPVPIFTGSNPNAKITPVSGTNSSYTASVMFEYPDGKVSGIVDSGTVFKVFTFTPGTTATYTITAIANALVDFETAIVGVSFDGEYVETVPIRAGMSINQIATLIRLALASNTNLASRWNITVATAVVTIAALNPGTLYNDRTILFTIEEPDPGDVDLTSAQSVTAENSIEGGVNQFQIHGLNTQVSSVYFLAKTGSTYRLIANVGIQSPYAHGCPYQVKLDNTEFGNLPVFPAPTASTDPISFRDHLALAIPPQNPRVDSQSRIVDNSAIQGIIPLTYDNNQNTLRYQVVVLTDQNVQFGYVQESGGQSLNIFDVNLEVIDPGVKALYGYGHARIQNAVLFQSNEGISMVEGRQVSLVVDKYRYPVISSGLTSIAYNKDHDEIWMFFDNESTVLVFDKNAGVIREYEFGTQDIRFGLYNDDKMLLGIGDTLYHTDKPAIYSEFGSAIVGTLVSKYLTQITQSMKLLELTVYGQNIDVAPTLDLQLSRKEGSEVAWTKSFTADYAPDAAEATMQGVSFQIHRRGSKPRLKLTLTNSTNGFIEDVRLKVSVTENSGKARQL